MSAPRIHGEGGKGRTRLYRVWTSMRERCLNRNHPAFPRYGGRGIEIFEGWADYLEFKDFAIKNGYRPGLQIDRIENDLGYFPENVRFVTAKENMRNRSSTKLSVEIADKIRQEYEDGSISQTALGKKYGVTQGCVGFIIRRERWG